MVAGKMVIDQAKQADTEEQGAYKHMKTVKAGSQKEGRAVYTIRYCERRFQILVCLKASKQNG